MHMNGSVSIVIAVYRTSGTLRELYLRLRQTLEACDVPFEIIFVDDASPDDSSEVIQSISREDKRVTLLPLKENAGQHKAILAGISSCRGDWALIMDADLQDAPEDFPALLSKVREGFDAVFAARQGKHEPFFRLLTSRLFKWMLRLLCGMNPDTGTFVLITRPMIDRLVSMRGPYPYIPGMIHCAGLPVASVPVTRARRPTGGSSYNTWRRIRLAWRGFSWVLAWKCSRRARQRG